MFILAYCFFVVLTMFGVTYGIMYIADMLLGETGIILSVVFIFAGLFLMLKPRKVKIKHIVRLPIKNEN